MAVYTCYDMIRDCQSDRAAGWIYLVEEFAPAIGLITSHYGGDDSTVVEVFRRMKRGEGPISSMVPCHQREFLYQLRPFLLGVVRSSPRESSPVSLDLVTEALAPLSSTERQAAWLETFGYDALQTAILMRMAPETVTALRARAGELLRAKLDDWSAGMLSQHGLALGVELELQSVAEPLEFRHFLDVIDGRITWQRRIGFDKQLEASWPEVHKACRIREADHALAAKTDSDTAPILTALDLTKPKPPLWKAILSRG